MLDQTGQDVLGFGFLNEEDVYWELSPKQREYQHMVQSTNSFLNEEYHALQTVLWRTGNPTFNMGMPARSVSRAITKGSAVVNPDKCMELDHKS